MTIIHFVLLLGGLIFFHEFGHFIVARACGIRVLEFSIGFGPELTSIERNGTVYRIGLLPLGGFVRMLGADPMEEVPAEDEEGAFGSKPLWQRTLVVLAGPVFNLILPFFVFFFFFLSTAVEVTPAFVGTLKPDGVADRAGLKSGDLIVEIDGEPIDGWWELQRIIESSAGKQLEVVVERDGARLPPMALTPATETEVLEPSLGLEREVGRVQIALSYRKPVIIVEPESAAYVAGLRSWDRILTVDDRVVDQWEVARRVLSNARNPVKVTVLRIEDASGEKRAVSVDIVQPAQTLVLDPTAGNGSLGISSAEFVIRHVTPGSAEARAGLQAGDEILTADGRRFSLWNVFADYIQTRPRKRVGDPPETKDLVEIELNYRRGVEQRSTRIVYEERTFKEQEFNTPQKVLDIGILNHTAYGFPEPMPNTERISHAAYKTWTNTARAFTLTLASLAGLFTGKVDFKQMGGPIFIYQVASKTTERGAGYFFNAMVWLSISLGLINLLPIPVLDGGHLAFFLIEAIKRSPVSLRARQVASYIGLSMIILLMVLVIKNDIQRNWDKVEQYFESDKPVSSSTEEKETE